MTSRWTGLRDHQYDGRVRERSKHGNPPKCVFAKHSSKREVEVNLLAQLSSRQSRHRVGSQIAGLARFFVARNSSLKDVRACGTGDSAACSKEAFVDDQMSDDNRRNECLRSLSRWYIRSTCRTERRGRGEDGVKPKPTRTTLSRSRSDITCEDRKQIYHRNHGKWVV